MSKIQKHNAFFRYVIDGMRSSLYFRSTVLNVVFKIGAMGASLLSVPLLLSYLGPELFGVWQTILAFLGWVALSNFGLGNGLRNGISALDRKHNIDRVGVMVSEALVISTLLTVGFFIVLLIAIGAFDVSTIFKGYNGDSLILTIALLYSLGFFCINLVVGLFNSVLFSFERSHVVSFNGFLLNTSFLLSLFVLKNLSLANPLIVISVIYGLLSVVITFGLGIMFIRGEGIHIAFYGLNFVESKKLLGLSARFFLVQVLVLLLFSMDNVFIGYFLDVNQVTRFNVGNRANVVLINLYSMLLIQLWGRVSAVNRDGKLSQILSVLRALKFFILLAIVLLIFYGFYYQGILAFWLGEEFDIERSSILLMSLYSVIYMWNALHVNVINGLSILRPQLISNLLGILAYLGTITVLRFLRILDLNSLLIARNIGILIPAFASTYITYNRLKTHA